jgi:hypothetical protein
LVFGDVQAPLGRHFAALLGHEARPIGADLDRDAGHLLRRGHLEIEKHLELGAKPADVFVLDVPTVFAQVRRDLLCAAGFGEARGLDHVGIRGAAQLAESRDMVDVDA